MKKMRGIAVWLFVCLLVAGGIAILCGAVLLDRAGCMSRWEKSGMRADWGPMTGCIVEVNPGRWLPADRVREIDLPKGR